LPKGCFGWLSQRLGFAGSVIDLYNDGLGTSYALIVLEDLLIDRNGAIANTT